MVEKMSNAAAMTGGQIGTLVILILLLGLAILALVVYNHIRQKISDFSQAVWGTEDFLEGVNRQADELANTPKSVSGMTRLMEPQIARDFPEFSWPQFKQKAENMLVSALHGIASKDASLVVEASPEVIHQIENRIRDNELAGIKEVYDNIHIHQTEISNYTKRDGKCVVSIQSALEYQYYREQDGKLLDGDKERKTQTRYQMELIYIQDETLANVDRAVGVTCPNCGAPVTNLGRMVCDYCGSEVVPLNIKVWSLHKFAEVDYNHM